MDALIGFSLPVSGLKTGVHQYQFCLDRDFFGQFEASPIEDAKIDVQLELDKRPDMMVLDFEISGHVKTECDRCTAEIELPIEDERQLLVKFGEADGDENDEVVFIHRDQSEFNVAEYLYEFSVIATPFIRTYDCENDENPPCNFKVLERLNPEDENVSPGNSVWDSLKNLNSDE